MNNMEQPLVSVITVTRNRANLIKRCIESIQNQTYQNLEHLIIDGASSDNTDEVVRSYNDSRIKYYKRDDAHSGQLDCFDFALEKATGEYLCFLDDDDEYLPEKIEKQIHLFLTLPEDYGMVYCWMTYYDASTGKVVRLHNPQVKGYVAEDIVEKPTVSGTPTFMFRADAFKSVGGFVRPEVSGLSSDWATGARFCQKWKVDYVPESLIKVYVNHGFTRMTDASKYYTDALTKTIKFHHYFLDTYVNIFDKYPEKGWYHYRGLITNNIRIGNYNEAWKYYIVLCKSKFSFSNLVYPIKSLVKKLLKW